MPATRTWGDRMEGADESTEPLIKEWLHCDQIKHSEFMSQVTLLVLTN